MNSSQKTELKVVPSKNPSAAVTTTQTGRVIDTLGFKSLTFAVQSGTITDGTFTPTFYKSETLNGGALENPVAVPAEELIGPAIPFVAADDDVVKTRGALVRARYYRCDLVASGSPATGGILAATAILGDPRYSPTP